MHCISGTGPRTCWDAAVHRARGVANDAAALGEETLVRRARGRRNATRHTLAVVFVWWNSSEAKPALERLHSALGRCLGDQMSIDVIVNNDEELPTIDLPGVVVARGDNCAAEFSGYDAGIGARRERSSSPDVWLICNDRYDAYLDGFGELPLGDVVDLLASCPAVCGQLDQFPEPVWWTGRDMTRWVRSSFVFIDDRTLRTLGTLVSCDGAHLDDLVPAVLPAREAPFPRLGRYGDYLGDWLTGSQRTPARQRWYGARSLDEMSWPALRRKAQSILNEHLLSARVRDLGVAIIGLRQLSAYIGAGASPSQIARVVRDCPQGFAVDHERPMAKLASLARAVALGLSNSWRSLLLIPPSAVPPREPIRGNDLQGGVARTTIRKA